MAVSTSTKPYTFFVEGMHCSSCELFIEKTLSVVAGIKKVNVNLIAKKITFQSETKPDIEKLNKLIASRGYKIVEKLNSNNAVNLKELGLGFLVATIIAFIFFLLQKLELVNFLNVKSMSLPFIFFIGFIASVSTCSAVVGGLVLSISSTAAKENTIKPIIAFHISRIAGFFILGGIVGLIGASFVITQNFTFVMSILLFIIMVLMGIDLLGIYPTIKRFQPKLPKFLGKGVLNTNVSSGIIGAGLLGMATFLLPCGFTQAMQIYALSTGSFINGALTMLVFALGTLPMLTLISFASVKLSESLFSKVFFKAAGFLIIFFAVVNLYSSLTVLGLIPIF